MGHALGEVGCIWLGRTQGEVVTGAPLAIAEFHAWLARHGEPALASSSQDLPAAADVVVEVKDIQVVEGFGRSGSAVGFFEPDLEPVTDDDIDLAVRRLGYARVDLLEMVGGLPGEVLDRRPPGGKRTVRENLIHIRNCHGFYLTRILGMEGTMAVLPEPWPEDDILASLDWVVVRAVAALRDLPPGLRQGVIRADHPAEDWTARKMLRRFVEHEREHVEVVRHTLEAREQAVGTAR